MRAPLISIAFGGLLAGGALPAVAADVLSYPSLPPITDPIYAPASLVTGDAALGLTYYSEPGYNALDLLGDARINMPVSGNWYVTGEVFGLTALKAPRYYELAAAAHLYHKTPQYAHGAFIGGVAYGESGYSGSEVTVGVEGAAFMTNSTWIGQLGYAAGNDGGNYDYWWVTGIGRYYVTPNTKLAGAIGWSNPDALAVSAGVEHLFDGTDISLFGNALYYTEGSFNSWQVTGGVRFFFHRPGGTLQQHDWDIPFTLGPQVNM
jgi:hypothetical protein